MVHHRQEEQDNYSKLILMEVDNLLKQDNNPQVQDTTHQYTPASILNHCSPNNKEDDMAVVGTLEVQKVPDEYQLGNTSQHLSYNYSLDILHSSQIHIVNRHCNKTRVHHMILELLPY